MAKYNRNITELKSKAAMWWPEELKTKNALANVLPLLLKTQEDFLHLIVLSKNDPFQLFDLIKVAKYPSNLFLKLQSQHILSNFLTFCQTCFVVLASMNSSVQA